MKRVLLIMGVIILICSNVLGQTAIPPPLGDGTADNPYQIATLGNLYWIAASDDVVNNPNQTIRWSSHYIQTDDIDASETVNWFLGTGWSPIGNYVGLDQTNYPFAGSYNGSGNVITDLHINRPGFNYRGLFGFTDGATISNLGLVDVNMACNNHSGALVGRNENSIVRSCFATGEVNGSSSIGGLIGYNVTSNVSDSYTDIVINGDFYVGGLIGHSFLTSITVDSYTAGTVSGSECSGGLIGNLNNSTVNNCSSSANVNGSMRVGGLVGYNFSSTIINSNSSGNVNGYERVGGLAGWSYQSSIVSNCYSTASVAATRLVGGLVGNNHVNSIIIDSYSTGNVSSTNYGAGGLVGTNTNNSTVANSYSHSNVEGVEAVGGLAGSSGGQISDCFSTGTVIGEESVGGFVGYVYTTTIENCYSLSDVSGEYSVGGLIGKIQDTDIINSHYNYEISLINDQHVITIGALDNIMFTTWIDNDLTLNIDDYLDSDSVNYLISSVDDLKMISAFGQLSDCSYLLTSDLDLVNYPGLYIPYFRGEFDGNNYIIANLTLTMSEQLSYLGLFGMTKGALIENCYLINAEVTGSFAIAGLVGYNLQSSVSNSSSTGSITGIYGVGGLMGFNDGSDTSNCFSKGSVTGTEYVGGLIGANGSSHLNNSYSTSSVYGSYRYVGGLVGRNSNTSIINCYSTGPVTGTNNFIGGLVGSGANPVNNNNYWNIETSGQTTSPIGEGRTTAEMTYPYAVNSYIDWNFEEIWAEDISSLINDGYPFLEWHLDYLRNVAFNPLPSNGSINIPVTQQEVGWSYILYPIFPAPDGFRLYLNTTGEFSEDDDFVWIPYLTNQSEYTGQIPQDLQYDTTYYWRVFPSEINPEREQTRSAGIRSQLNYHERTAFEDCPIWSFTICSEDYPAGSGTEDDPWQIATAEHLNIIRNFLGAEHANKYFVQTADINLDIPPWNTGEGWLPIGNSHSNAFQGNYNGNNHKIEGLFINRDFNDAEYQGLFGYVVESAIKNLALLDVEYHLNGSFRAGALVGYSKNSTISNCYSTGIINGSLWVGGLIGWIDDDTVLSSCFSTVDVSGINHVGGLVGRNEGSLINNCYSLGSVIGNYYIGGLVGSNYFSAVASSYSTGLVTGTLEVGGLIGRSENSTVGFSYWNIETSNQSTSIGGGLGRTTDEMTYPYASNTYLYWNFDNVWAPDEDYSVNNGYPYLQETNLSVYDNPLPDIEQLLLYNFPNPFNPLTMINFNLNKPGHVSLEIYNTRGQTVKTLLNYHLNSGKHQIEWDGTNNNGRKVTSGIYFYRLITADYDETRKMLLLK